jgi:hypothetical protein
LKKTGSIIGGLGLLLIVACGGHSHQPAPRHGRAPTTAAARTARPAPAGAATANQPASAPPALGWWHPASVGPDNGPRFQWELDHPLQVGSAADMGGGALNAAGQPTARPTVYDIDGIENPASTVAALHRLGARVICYIEVGAAGNYYSAASEGIPVSYYSQLGAAGDLGRKVPGYPERYLNINAASTVSVITSLIRRQCAAKGFDAVEPDIDDSYTASTGYGITMAQNVAFDRALGAYAHSLGLAWGQKNGDSDPAFSVALEPTTDFLLTEECSFYHTCQDVTPAYVRAGKLVLDAEYTDDWGGSTATDLSRFCAADLSGRMDGTLFTSALAGPRNPCR